MSETVLLLDDVKAILSDLGRFLDKKGYVVYTATTIKDAKKIIISEQIDFAIVDLKIDFSSEFGGLSFVNFAKRNRPGTRAIVLSSYPGVDADARLALDVEIDGYIAKGGQENYIHAVFRKLQEIGNKESEKKCFVIMPFSTSVSCRDVQWTDIFSNTIKPAVEEAGFGYACERSEALHGNIIEDILDRLNRADLIVADLTDKNPNVFYELGVRHALRGSTILIAQDLDDVPFDLRPYATHTYDWTTEKGREQFKQRVKEVISFIEAKPAAAQSPVRRYLDTLD